jgi:hypothetical protein
VGVPEKYGIIEDNEFWPLKTNLYSIESRSQKNGKLPVCPPFLETMKPTQDSPEIRR